MNGTFLKGSHDALLVALSIAIAIAAAYTALDLAARVRASAGRLHGLWLAAAALVMGGGIWSMHFVAMLALSLPLPMAYAPGLTAWSLAIPVLGSGLGFAIMGRRGGRCDLALGGLLMGGGIAAMHYTGMAAMQMPARLHYDGPLVAVSVMIAIGAATVALWLSQRDSAPPERAIAAAVMGLAIAGMHYTAMQAASWAPLDDAVTAGAHDHGGLGQAGLALGAAAATFLILFLALVAALTDRHFTALAERRAQAALEESETRLRDLLATLDLGTLMARDPDGTIRFWSEGCARLYGWTAAEAVGRNAHALLHSRFPVPQAEIEAALERDGEWIGDLHHRTRDGRELVVTARKVLRRGPKGQPLAVLESLTDVTAQRRAEMAEAEGEARFRTIVEQLGAGLSQCNGDGRYLLVNERFCEMVGRTREELLGGLCMPDITHPDDLPTNLPAFARAFREGIPFTIEKRLLRPEGTVVWVSNSVAATRDAEGRVTGVVAVSQDITARRAAEAALAESEARHRDDLEQLVEERTAALLRAAEERRRAEEAMRQTEKLAALGQLTGGVAHDFNNLLQVVTSGAALLRRPALPEAKKAEILEGMIQAGRSARELTTRLLAFARRQTLRPEVIDVSARLAGMSELLRQTLGSRTRVETDIAPGLWPVRVDASQFEVAIVNLAVNARDAMPEGGTITIQARNVTLEAAPERTAGDYVCIAVKDTGKGMPPHILSRVIEPFFTTKEAGLGTGLGLPQVHGFARQSGGDLQIESEPGNGTAVFFHLPRAAAEDEVAEPAAERQPHVLQGVGKTVLVVEDNPDVAAFACSLLEELGYTTQRTGSAAEALALLAAGQRVDVVFSDVVMPGGISGVELAAVLRFSYPYLPVVLATGYSEQLARSGAPEGIETLGKPYHPDELAAALERALARRWKLRDAPE